MIVCNFISGIDVVFSINMTLNCFMCLQEQVMMAVQMD